MAKSETVNKRLESDLYIPVRDFLTSLGYTVRAEVDDCDIAAVKGEELLIVELKLNLTVELLTQAVKRQRMTDLVYIAVPKPVHFKSNAKYRDLQHLLRRLELGLLFVSFRGNKPLVEPILEPLPFERSRSQAHGRRKRSKMLSEINARSIDANLGGSNRRKLLTAYREQAIQIACCLAEFGPMSARQLRQKGTDAKKTLSIMYVNHYGWFERCGKGVYALTSAGRAALDDYPELTTIYRKTFLEVEE